MEDPPKKKTRENSFKRWRDHEIVKVLEYISGNPCAFEKPTARAYYTEMLEKIQIDATWDLIKWKLRHIKQKYYKALELQKSIDFSISDDHYSLIQDKILNMCPQFDLLTQIFGGNTTKTEYFEIFEPEDSNFHSIIKTENYTMEPMRPSLEIKYNENILNKTNDNDGSILQQKCPPSSDATVSNHKEENFISTPSVQSTNTIMQSPSSFMLPNTELCLSSLPENERAKYLQNMFDLEKRKIEIEEYKTKRECEMNKIKLQQDFEIRKLEIEKDERVAKYEIEMKYKYIKQ